MHIAEEERERQQLGGGVSFWGGSRKVGQVGYRAPHVSKGSGN